LRGREVFKLFLGFRAGLTSLEGNLLVTRPIGINAPFRLPWGPIDRVHHTSLSAFPPPRTGQVFRPPAREPDKSSAAVLSEERRSQHRLPRWTTDGEEAITLEDLRDEFPEHCVFRNLVFGDELDAPAEPGGTAYSRTALFVFRLTRSPGNR
jgi:hypothetical protein